MRDKISQSAAQKALLLQTRHTTPADAQVLTRRARDLKGDVSPEDLIKLLTP